MREKREEEGVWRGVKEGREREWGEEVERGGRERK